MSEVLTIGFLKNELLKAAARKRKQAPRMARSGSSDRRVEGKLPQQDVDKHSR
jgi:hypothetical protein